MSRTIKYFALTMVAGLGLMMTNPAHADTTIVHFNNGNIKVVTTERHRPPQVVYYGPARDYAFYQRHHGWGHYKRQMAWRDGPRHDHRFDPRFGPHRDMARYDNHRDNRNGAFWVVERD